jgi:hypothetical protein
MLRRVLFRLPIVSGTAFSLLAFGPSLMYGHGHDVNHCGNDINEFAKAVAGVLDTRAAGADEFEKKRHAPMCGALEDKTTFYNATGFPVRHRFKTSHSTRTEYNVKVSGGFKSAFQAEVGYKSDRTKTEEYDTEVEIPPRRAAKLSVSPSIMYTEGTWRRGKKNTYVEVFRPTGHMLWILRDVTNGG